MCASSLMMRCLLQRYGSAVEVQTTKGQTAPHDCLLLAIGERDDDDDDDDDAPDDPERRPTDRRQKVQTERRSISDLNFNTTQF